MVDAQREAKDALAAMRYGVTPAMVDPHASADEATALVQAAQARALFADQESLAKAYDALATALPENGYVCEQSAMTKPDAYEKAWCQALTDVTFEGETFKAPAEYDKFLTTLYGDYMQLPPENERENRHQIVQIDFGA